MAKQTGALSILHPNPLVRKLSRVQERSEDAASYAGVAKKCLIFLISVAVGIAAALYLNTIAPFTVDMEGTAVELSPVSIIGMLVSLVFFIVTPFVAFLIRKTIPVTGILYCISTGYIYTMMPLLVPEYGPILGLAFLLTIAIVAVMAVVYSSGLVKVSGRFRTVVTIAFFTMVAGSLLTFVAYLIPATRGLASYVVENPVLGIAGSVIFVVIAALFLLVDFETIRTVVEDRLPAEYEWMAAFSLIFSVIWLFIKVFDLLVRLKGKD